MTSSTSPFNSLRPLPNPTHKLVIFFIPEVQFVTLSSNLLRPGWSSGWPLGYWPLAQGCKVRFLDHPARSEINFSDLDVWRGWFIGIDWVLDPTAWFHFIPRPLEFRALIVVWSVGFESERNEGVRVVESCVLDFISAGRPFRRATWKTLHVSLALLAACDSDQDWRWDILGRLRRPPRRA